MSTKENYYSNPAFCQQSEFFNGQRSPHSKNPQGTIRQSPVGAQTTHRVLDTSTSDEHKPTVIDEEGVEEQEFYEEVVVDDKGFITEKKFVIIAQNNEGKKYIQAPQVEERYESRYNIPQGDDTRYGSRYEVPHQIKFESQRHTDKYSRNPNQRYEYIQMQEQDSRYVTPKTSPTKSQFQEEPAIRPGKVHRYAVIETEEETELTSKNSRYALVPVSDLHNVIVSQNRNVEQGKNRYEYIQDHQIVHQSPNRYEYIQTSPQKPMNNRYEYIHQLPQQKRLGNPIATQKLHQLLSTPKKTSVISKSQTIEKMLSPQSVRKFETPPVSPILKQTPQIRNHPQKAQQKLNYTLGTRQLIQQDKRHTAIVAPICSSPIQAVYGETTYSSKSESWMNLSGKRSPVQATLAIAAVMMLLCGGVSSGLCFYMISIMGRLYYLDFGIVSGFTCLTLGLLGYRTRNVYWLPNRNYISGYLLLSVFSLLTCAGLLVLLVMQPRSGTPLADMTSGAVCGISVFSLVLATTGVVSSYCCKYPPPDNRVQHCAEGFTV